MPSLTAPAKQQFFTNAGAIAAGYKLWTYAAGTTTPQATYVDRNGASANANPIILDSRGEAIIYADDGLAYDFQLQDTLGNVIWTRQGVVTSLWQIRSDLASTASGKGAAQVGYKLPDAQSIAATVQAKLDGTANFISDFAGVANNVTDNATAFQKAEASAYQRIYLPEGTYYTTSAFYQITKYYYGPGKIRLSSGSWQPGRSTTILNSPTKGTGTDVNYYFGGDLSRVRAEEFVLGTSNANVRRSLTESYFESTTTPRFNYFVNYSGGSGSDARIPGTVAAGATSLVVNNAGGLVTGAAVVIDKQTSASQNITITSIVGTTVYFTPALATALNAYSSVAQGVRTMNQYEFVQLNHIGPGDAYCNTFRVNVNYVPTAGQDHFFNTSTAGFLGGDINHNASGGYSTTFESQCNDNGYDVAHIAWVETFNRSNAVGNWGGVWLGTFFKSQGTAYADAAHVVSGKFKRGLDTVLMTPDADKAAVNLAQDQRIYFNSTATADGKMGLSFFGNNVGTAWMEYSSSLGALNAVVAGTSQLQIVNGGVKFPTSALFQGNIGFFSANAAAKQTVSGAKGSNAALGSLIAALVAYGLITDTTTA